MKPTTEYDNRISFAAFEAMRAIRLILGRHSSKLEKPPSSSEFDLRNDGERSCGSSKRFKQRLRFLLHSGCSLEGGTKFIYSEDLKDFASFCEQWVWQEEQTNIVDNDQHSFVYSLDVELTPRGEVLMPLAIVAIYRFSHPTLRAFSVRVKAPRSQERPPQVPQPAPPHILSQGSPLRSQTSLFNSALNSAVYAPVAPINFISFARCIACIVASSSSLSIISQLLKHSPHGMHDKGEAAANGDATTKQFNHYVMFLRSKFMELNLKICSERFWCLFKFLISEF
uniref:Uncharacterized protein n=1 Tax=Glossina pallidipes TaxID=7398 RepID=A0A1B0AIU6_GLOPL